MTKIKYTEMYLTKGMPDLYIERYKILPRRTGKDLNKNKLLLF